ncbi:MAG: dephospho-CoA kinase [Porphyromonadaceae bacterium]|nr:dephospho-CoA kinase [Porphyromonadaceae bacterium]
MQQTNIQTVGITGGIGSGKSLITAILATYGIPVYDTDKRAKTLYDTDTELRAEVIRLFGESLYATADGKLDRSLLASIIFSNPIALARINALVHPAVRRDFSLWREGLAQCRVRVCAIESALLVGGVLERMVDDVLVVVADDDTRIRRATRRDAVQAEAIQARIRNQMSQAEMILSATWVIDNNDGQPILPQIEALPFIH